MVLLLAFPSEFAESSRFSNLIGCVFSSTRRKRLTPDWPEVASTESGALKKAEAMSARRPGTAAIQIVADDETGELETAAILGQFGEVPDDFAESFAS